MSERDNFVVMEIYHNVHEYTSLEGQVYLLRAICPTLQSAAETIAKAKTQEMQRIVDNHTAQPDKPVSPFTQNMFVIKVTDNTFVDTTNIPRTSVTEADLSEGTLQQLHAVMEAYKAIFAKNMTTLATSAYKNLHVDPSLYEKDRRAREYELMQRLHIRPLWRGNVTGGGMPKRKSVVPLQNGDNPQPMTAVQADNQTRKCTRLAEPELTSPTVSTSAPAPLPGLLPVTTVGGGTVNNFVTNSAGPPPQNTGAAVTSRVTGI